MKASPKAARKKKAKQTETSSDEHENTVIKMEMESPTTSVIRNTKLENIEIEIQDPSSIDEQHFIIDDNITVESNIEIEFITSDELIPSEMDGETIDYENSDKKYENDFVDEISSKHDGDDDYDGGNESWDNVRLTRPNKLNWFYSSFFLRRTLILNQMKLNTKSFMSKVNWLR